MYVISNRKGFTLIEIMVVVVILSILATVVTIQVIDYIHKGRVTKVRTDIASFESALELYKMDAGKYPTTEQGLNALVSKPTLAPIPLKWKEKGIQK